MQIILFINGLTIIHYIFIKLITINYQLLTLFRGGSMFTKAALALWLLSQVLLADGQELPSDEQSNSTKSFIEWCYDYEDGYLVPAERRTMYAILSAIYYRPGPEGCEIARMRLDDLFTLVLTEKNLVSLEPIASLVEFKKLNELILDNNGIIDISPLKDLTQLKVLRLDENRVTNISSLQYLTKLTDLDLSENQIDDFTPLSYLTSLRNLNLTYAGIHDVRPLVDALKPITTLQELNLGANDIVDPAPLNELREMYPNLHIELDNQEMCSTVQKSSPKWIRELCRSYICENLSDDVPYWKVKFCNSEPTDPEDEGYFNQNGNED